MKKLTSALLLAGEAALPGWLSCQLSTSEMPTLGDGSMALYQTLGFVLPGALEPMPSDLAQDLSGKESGCLFQQLLQSKPMQLLFQLLHQQPVLSLILSDLGHLVDESTGKQSGDLTLEPWYHEHCKVVPQCQENFSTAVLAEEVQWKMVAKGLYSALQPHLAPPKATEAKGSRLAIAAVGSHSGLALGVSNALLEALKDETEVQLSYFGHWAWCQNVENCQEPMALIFQDYQQDWAESEDHRNEEKYQELLLQLAGFLQKAPSDLLGTDLLLCTRPFLFCWLLRELWPNGFQQVPMLHYYSGPLLFDTTPSQKQPVLEAFRQTVLTSELDLVVSSSVLQSAWILSMSGLAVPHVRPHATQLRGLYQPREADHRLRALVLRSTWVNSIMAQAFRNLLAVMQEGSFVDLEWLVSGKFLSYEEIAKFHAAVFFPEQPDKLTFWEQYEMAMPLWLPSAELWSKIHAIGEFRYSVFAQRWFAQLTRENPGEEHCLPLPVFFHTDVPKHG